MAKESRPAPLVALLTRWAMLQARQKRPVPGELFLLLAVLAERYSHEKGFSFPGPPTLCRDLGIGARGLRKEFRAAESLGAIRVKVGRGRGNTTEVRFTDEVWTAPNLDTLAFMDRQNLPQKGNGRSPFPSSSEEKRGTGEPEKGNGEVPKRGTGVPPYRCSTAVEPLFRPSAGSISPTDERTTDNGALNEEQGMPLEEGDSDGVVTGTATARPMRHFPARVEPPLPRVEQFRRALAGSGRYVPLSEDEEARRREILAEQAAELRRAAGGC